MDWGCKRKSFFDLVEFENGFNISKENNFLRKLAIYCYTKKKNKKFEFFVN